MEYKEKKINISILVIIAGLVGAGTSNYLTQDQFDDAYVCSSTGDAKFCTGNEKHPAPLSGSLSSCYWTDEAGKGRRTSCSEGYWQSLRDYCEQNNVDPKSVIMGMANKPVHATGRAKTETCTPGDLRCVANR